jgi:hypothetical protein
MKLQPLVPPINAHHMRHFRRFYAMARDRDPVAFPPQNVIARQIEAGECIAALVSDGTDYVAAFVLDIDRAHEALCVTVAAGKGAHEWADLMEDVAKIAANDLGLKRLWVHGRRGLQPILKERGFQQKYVVYAKELTDGVRGKRQQRVEREPAGSGLSGDPEAVFN